MKSQPLQAPARTHSSCKSPASLGFTEDREIGLRSVQSCSKSNPLYPSRGAGGHLRVTEPERPSLCRIETPRRRLCRARSGSACDPATAAHWAKGTSEQLSITRSILLICEDCRSSSFRGRMTCLRATVHVSLPACDLFSKRRRFVFGPWDA
jgi:hypothetical protein